jgi:hypothetical protein
LTFFGFRHEAVPVVRVAALLTRQLHLMLLTVSTLRRLPARKAGTFSHPTRTPCAGTGP